MPPTDDLPISPIRRLNTWGEIAGYLDVSIRTAQGWETNLGLPIHRIGGRVWADPTELDQWSTSRENPPVQSDEGPDPPSHAPHTADGVLRPYRRRRLRWGISIVGSLGILALLSLTSSSWLRSKPTRNDFIEDPEPRLFASVSSESETFRAVPLPHSPTLIAVSPDDTEVYLATERIPALIVVETKSWQTQVIDLPTPIAEIRASPRDHLVFLSSMSDGFFIYDRRVKRIVDHIHAGGPVTDVIVSPSSGDFYVAMMHKGVRRLSRSDRSWKQVTTEGCPYFLDVDRRRGLLLVSYQCGGPTGREGHDAIELIDLRSDRSIAVSSGPPLVGGQHRFSPDGSVAWLAGRDACRTSTYDHQGCSLVPSDVIHIFRVADQRVVKTLVFPPYMSGEPTFFPNGSRVFLGEGSRVVEASQQYRSLEAYKMPGQSGAALAPDARRLYIMRSALKQLAVVDAEPSGCSGLGPAAIHLLSGDGTDDDSIENALVSPELPYRPGYVGQAFKLDGEQQSVIQSSSGFRFGIGDSTVALYLKPSPSGQGSTLLEWKKNSQSLGWRLSVDKNERLRFDFSPRRNKTISLESPSAIPINTWTHVAVTKTDTWLRLYLDGVERASTRGTGEATQFDHHESYKLGWGVKPDSAFVGLIDEVAFWARALPAAEIGTLYQRRSKGACRI